MKVPRAHGDARRSAVPETKQLAQLHPHLLLRAVVEVDLLSAARGQSGY